HVFIHLIGSDGRTVAQSDSQPANELAPTSTWRPGDPLADGRRLHLPPDLPPGLYDLRVGLYLLGTHERLMLDPEGGTSFSLGSIKVGRLPEPALPDVPRDVDFGGRLRLIGHDRPELRDGRLSLSLQWSADRPLVEDYTLFVHLVDAAGRLVVQHDGPPHRGGYPTRFWTPGERVAEQVDLPLPADLPAGRYRLLVGAYRTSDVQRLMVTGTGADAVELESLDLPVGSPSP
ncbi:MAG TPA: hypothetical protein VHL09_03600, partial [Dehalococcoidia bacterium]|nr:hypothetical protein [Dehalococcoidia bacterium]